MKPNVDDKSTVSISPSPTSDADWTIHSLNIQGTFFERWCKKIIKEQSDWEVVSTSYPVEFPRHNGLHRGEQSTLDIRAQIKKDDTLLTVLIECKKNNPDFTNWVFFPHEQLENKEAYMVSPVIKCEAKSNKEFNWQTQGVISTILPGLKWKATADAWETRISYKDYKNNDKTRTSNSAITRASEQISLATRSIYQEECEDNKALSKKTSGMKIPYRHQIIVPMIVTTANLFICKFNPNDINPATGEIPFSKVILEEQPYLLYEYPLPVHLHIEPNDKVEVIKSGHKDTIVRMDIVVVNSLKFADLLSKLAK